MVDQAARWLAGRWEPAPAGCAVLDWAGSGAMALTGMPGGPPSASPAGLMGPLRGLLAAVRDATGLAGSAVDLDPGVVLSARAGLLGWERRGRVSANGTCRLLRASDGWCAVNLARPSDVESVPAIVGGAAEEPWQALAAYAEGRPAAEVVARVRMLDVPAAVLGEVTGGGAPWRVRRVAPAGARRSLEGALVVDLSAMWAGPLCAYVLGRAGARVVKVESPARPDGARTGSPEFYAWLHAGHETLVVDFADPRLAELIDAADIVIEASRPRALRRLGLGVDQRAPRPGRTWVGITGYGRGGEQVPAFGDDAAVAGGLVAWTGDGPAFCADAIADPLTGLAAALAATASTLTGGGHLIDVPMARTAHRFAAASSCPAPAHPVTPAPGAWHAHCPAEHRTVEVRVPSAARLGQPDPAHTWIDFTSRNSSSP